MNHNDLFDKNNVIVSMHAWNCEDPYPCILFYGIHGAWWVETAFPVKMSLNHQAKADVDLFFYYLKVIENHLL